VNFTKLRLISSLYYLPFDPCSGNVFARALDSGEREALFWYEIRAAQACSIEPDSGAYLGPLIAAGNAAAAGNSVNESPANAALILPAGGYLFTQVRNGPHEADKAASLCVELAVELQKEGLWERLTLGNTVYFRTLWEDGARVFQALRPFTA
jgi:hypothetical protein